jgi:DNA-binding transcriptional LysR family regulator
MDKLTCMQALAKVVEAGSLAEAARRMGVSAPMVTKYISHLETIVGARLLNRTTHTLSLTQSGHAYYQRCLQVLDDIAAAEMTATALNAHPRGALRVSASASFAAHQLSSVALSYAGRYPDVRLDLSLNNHAIDLAEDGFDLAIRTATHVRSNVQARRLASSRIVACASPTYLKDHGEPRLAENLVHHNCLAGGEDLADEQWKFERADRVTLIKASGTLRLGSCTLLKSAALAGHGVVALPTFCVAEELKAGTLVTILDDYTLGKLGIYVLFHNRRHLSAKVRTFVDLLIEHFGEDGDADPFWKSNEGK